MESAGEEEERGGAWRVKDWRKDDRKGENGVGKGIKEREWVIEVDEMRVSGGAEGGGGVTKKWLKHSF